MKKVLDKALEARIKELNKGETPEKDIVDFLKEVQDAGGVKICQNVTETDVAYRKI